MHHRARMNKNDAIEKSLKQIDNAFIKALAEPTRIEILKQLITHGPSDVKNLSERMPQDRSVISRHLILMQNAGLLTLKKEGRHVIYSIDAKKSLYKSEQIVSAIRECIQFGCC